MPQLSRGRRACVAAFALAASAVLFRSQVADALVVRGDDFLYRGDRAAALLHYKRALSIDGHSEAAADRFVFIEMQQRTGKSLRDAVAVSTVALSAQPHDAVLLADRALCLLLLRRYDAARSDFESAARINDDARYYTFAGWASFHAGNLIAARALWRAALRADPRFRAASMALAEHHS